MDRSTGGNHHVVNILPVVQGDQLQGRQHGVRDDQRGMVINLIVIMLMTMVLFAWNVVSMLQRRLSKLVNP